MYVFERHIAFFADILGVHQALWPKLLHLRLRWCMPLFLLMLFEHSLYSFFHAHAIGFCFLFLGEGLLALLVGVGF